MNQTEIDAAASNETAESVAERVAKIAGSLAIAELNMSLATQQSKLSELPRPPMEAVRSDDGKARFDLLPVRPLQDVVDVLTVGAQEYGVRNWETGFRYGRCFASLCRHIYAWWGGQDLDPITKKSHLAHAICNLLFLLEFYHTGKGLDDRVKAAK